MNKYIIQYGISGGFNDSDRYMVVLAEEDALEIFNDEKGLWN